MKYKINSYKVGFFTILQSNLQLHKNEEHLNQPSFTSRVKFKTLKIEHTSNSPPPTKKNKTKQNKTEWLELSLCTFPKQRIIYQGKKIWCWFYCHVVLHSLTMLKCVSHKCTGTELSHGAKSYPSAAWGWGSFAISIIFWIT